jgi:predicted CoA-binding protein
MATPGDRSFLVEDPEVLRQILLATRTIAVVGLSSSPLRPSHDVAAYLQAQGYRILPINPGEREVMGERAWKNLAEVPREIAIDLVDVFRRPSEVAPHVEEVIARGGVRCLWLQDGVVDWESARRAHSAGLEVVMDDCTLRRHRQLIGQRGR